MFTSTGRAPRLIPGTAPRRVAAILTAVAGGVLAWARAIPVVPLQVALKPTRAGIGSAQPRVAAFDDRDLPDRRIFPSFRISVSGLAASTNELVLCVLNPSSGQS
jgi:hypothetical protein